MDKTERYYGFSISVILTLVMLCFIYLIIGCSSKKDKADTEKPRPAKTDVNTPLVTEDTRIIRLPDTNPPANIPPIVKEEIEAINEPCEAEVSIDTISNELSGTSDNEKKVELLRSLFDRASEHDPCIIGIVQNQVTDKDGNVATAAIELLQGYESPEVLPAVAEAMKHPDEDVRLAAVNLLLDINDPQTGKLLSSALSDKSEDIRSTALDEIKYKDTDVQFKVLDTAISSPYSDVKEESIFMLQYIGGPRAVDTLIEAMRDKDPEFRQTAASAISTLIDKDFTSYREAKAWWRQNKDKYDEDLNLIEDQQEASE
jgi:hypothetical protein